MQQRQQIPPGADAEEYQRILRNQRMAQALTAQQAAPMDYDPRGFISGGQLLGKALGDINSRYYNNAADEDTAKAITAKNAKTKQMFQPQQLGNALQNSAMNIPNMSAEQSQFIYENNPKLWEQVQSQNLTPDDLRNKFRKESVNSNLGLMVFDPSTGKYEPAMDSDGNRLTGAPYDTALQGNLSYAKQQGQNQSDLQMKPIITTDTEKAKSNVELALRPEIERQTVAARAKAEQEATKNQTQAVASAKLEDAIVLCDDLKKADFNKIYGRGESLYPELARSQEGINMIAKRNQLVAMLKLGAAGELKGQGSITDPERQMIGEAATMLANPNIDPKLARESLDMAMTVFRRNAGKAANPAGKNLSDDDSQAIAWANANPSDPRAQAIKQLHGIK